MAGSDGEPKFSRITVLISGNGSNLQALLDAANTSALPHIAIIRVISDRKDAYGLKRAHAANVPTVYHGILPYKKKYPDSDPDPQWQDARRAYDTDLASLVLADNPHLVVCAGFMRILSIAFLDPLKAAGVPIINLHPSLHGDLVGAGCIKRAWDEFKEGKRKETGIMIHYVIAEVDMGEPIVQEKISIEGCQNLPDLEERIHDREHGLIVQGTKIALEKLRSEGG